MTGSVQKCDDFGACSVACGEGTVACLNTCNNGEFGLEEFDCPESQTVEVQSCTQNPCPRKEHKNSGTWTSADNTPATYQTYGGNWGGNFPASNLKQKSGMWISAGDTGPRGIKVTFAKEVTITRFSVQYLKFHESVYYLRIKVIRLIS